MSVPWTDAAAEAIARLVSSRTGFTYALQHPAKTEEGIRRAMEIRGSSSMPAYLRTLQDEPKAMDQLVDELTIRETYFFREPRHFDFIREHIVPETRRQHGEEHVFRAWSAGCASGEEAYSLAILVDQAGVGDRASVLGTDISHAALDTARAGRFRDWSLRGAGSGFLARYFRARGPAWELIDPIRRRVRFSFLNLALDSYPSHVSGTFGMDLILCRNVLIYFDAWTVEQVTKRLAASLAPGGWLVTASSDPTPGRNAGLVPHVTEHGVFYQRPVETMVAEVPEVVRPAPIQRATVKPMRPVTPRSDPVEPPDTPEARYERARKALRQGDYEQVLELVPDLGGNTDACRLRIDALANQRGPDAAVAAASQALRLHPLSTTLHFRHAVLLSSLGHLDASEEALRRVIYLDRGLAVAHFALGAIHWRLRRLDAARRSYRTAARLSADVPPESELPLADGQTAGALAAAAQRHLASLGGQEEAIPA
ncbi:MAG: protein-glutamate O-methyltransferase CheR [Planctomycetota bacterium]|nr:protein-glutamate O-methyltransferase CheR [Planctomycetota bacterium]